MPEPVEQQRRRRFSRRAWDDQRELLLICRRISIKLIQLDRKLNMLYRQILRLFGMIYSFCNDSSYDENVLFCKKLIKEKRKEYARVLARRMNYIEMLAGNEQILPVAG